MRTAATKIGSDRGGRKSPPEGASATKPAKLARGVLGRGLVAAVACLGVAVVTAYPARGDEPSLAPPRLTEGEHFTIDPVVDGVITIGGAGFSGLLSLILSTGEIRPGMPGDSNKLLAIDRVAVTQTLDPHASMLSGIGLYAVYAYAVGDVVRAGLKDGRWALLVDALLYAESIAITESFTDATKIAVRRPRPIDYINCSSSGSAASSNCSSTDLQLSFFSGHAAATGAVSATATYLAFVRGGHRSPRAWLTLAGGIALTTFVSYERVRSGMHFPTDVIMGSLAGASIGVLVPHLHRRPHYHDKELESVPLWIGFAPTAGGGGTLTLGGML